MVEKVKDAPVTRDASPLPAARLLRTKRPQRYKVAPRAQAASLSERTPEELLELLAPELEQDKTLIRKHFSGLSSITMGTDEDIESLRPYAVLHVWLNRASTPEEVVAWYKDFLNEWVMTLPNEKQRHIRITFAFA